MAVGKAILYGEPTFAGGETRSPMQTSHAPSETLVNITENRENLSKGEA